MQTGPPQFQQPPPRSAQRPEIIFLFGIELPGRRRPGLRHHAIDTDHRLILGLAPINQQEVIKKRVKAIHFPAGDMIDHRPIGPKLINKDRIAQALRRVQILRAGGKA